MITVEKIKLLLPDQVLVALTDDAQTGAINEALIQRVIDDGYNYVNAQLPLAKDAVKDEFVKSYVLSQLYAYAGLDDKARNYQEIYMSMLQSLSPSEGSATAVKAYSNSRQFTEDELEKW